MAPNFRTLTLYLLCLTSPLSVKAQDKINKNSSVKWINAGFSRPSFEHIKLDTQVINYTHQLALDIVLLRNSQWTKPLLLKRYLEAARVYSSCKDIKLKFYPARIISIDSPNQISEFRHGTEIEESTETIAERIPNKNTVTMIHVQTLLAPYHATSAPLFAFGEGHPRLYKQWVAYRSAWEVRPPIIELEYNSETHELAHVLLNDGIHTFEPSDVMSLEAGGKRLSQQQCNKITLHPEVLKL